MVKKAQQVKVSKSTAAKASKAAAAKAPISKPQKPDRSVAQKLKQRSGPKWDLAKLATDQYLSMTSYMTVLNITSMVAVRNQHGNTMQMSKELLETMYSAQHYDREVGMNMTGLAELLQSVQDIIFTISFKKQANKENAFQLLQNAGKNWFKDDKVMAALAKGITQGESCVMTCRMVQVENSLGRSLVVDLKADSADNKFR